MATADSYVAGGTVQSGGGTYIARPADDELISLCHARAFVYLLSSRQVGKSSLMEHASEQLRQEHVSNVIIDLSELGVETSSADQWYVGFLAAVVEQLGILCDVGSWWITRNNLTRSQRLLACLREEIIANHEGPLVIFVDEVDSTRSLPFADDFYAAIRAVYNSRQRVPEFRRLSFVLIGVAAPTDLIKDPKRTPFNVGVRLNLTDFTYEEALPLSRNLGMRHDEAAQVLRWMFAWTGGHPYLTQRLAQAISHDQADSPGEWTASRLERIVKQTFLGPVGDSNLRFVRDMLTTRAPDRAAILTLYRQILTSRTPVPDDEQSAEKTHLKLAGVVLSDDGTLKPRNRLYETAFDTKWVDANTPVNWPRRLQRAATITGIVFLLLLVPLAIYSMYQYSRAQRAYRAAQNAAEMEREARTNAERARLLAENARHTAETASAAARQVEAVAVQRARELDMANNRLSIANQDLVKERQQAEAARLSALEATAKAIAARDVALKEEQRANAATTQAKSAMASAVQLRSAAFSRQLAFQSELLIRQQPDLVQPAILLAIEAMRRGSQLEADHAIRNGLASFLPLIARPLALASFRGGQSVAFSPDGEFIAFGTSQGIQIRNVLRGKGVVGSDPTSTIATSGGAPLQLTFSASGRYLLSMTVTSGRVIEVFDVKTRRRIFTKGPYRSQTRAAYTPDERALILASGSTVEIVDPLSGKTIGTLPSSRDVFELGISPDGRVLALAEQDSISLWDLDKLRVLARQRTEGPVFSLAFSGDGRFLAERNAGGATVIEVASNRVISSVRNNGENVVTISPDGQFLLTCGPALASPGGEVRIWDLHTGRPTGQISTKDEITAVSFSPKGDLLATASRNTDAADGITLWDMTGNATTHPVPAGWAIEQASQTRSLAASPSDAVFAGGGSDGAIHLWEATSGKRIRELVGHSGPITALAYSPDGRALCSGSQDDTLRIWDVRDGSNIFTATLDSPANTIGFDRAGKNVIAVTQSGALVEFDAVAGKNVGVIHRDAPIMAAFFLAAGNSILGIDSSGTLYVWNAADRALLDKIDIGIKGDVRSVALALDNQTLAVSDSSGSVKLFDIASKREITPKTGFRHESAVTTMSFNPGGAYLSTGGIDRTARIWSVASGKELVRISYESTISGVAFSRDDRGKFLAITSLDESGRVLLWNPADVIEEACSRLTRNLSVAEWAQYLEGEPFRSTCPSLPVPASEGR